jgi:aspartate aminotransferase
MAVSDSIQEIIKNASFIRMMFEEGRTLKEKYGIDKVCDFSIGNPDVPPPDIFYKTLAEESAKDDKGIHGYMPNAGFPHVRKAVADYISAEQEKKLSSF